MPSSAEEAIARAKAIAARLAGTANSMATPTTGMAAPSPAQLPAAVVDPATARAAQEALDMALGGAVSGGAGPTGKRKRWSTGDDAADGSKRPETVAADSSDAAAALSIANAAESALAAAFAAGSAKSVVGKTSRKLPIPTEKYPGYNFVGLLIGPGGSKQRDLVARAGGDVRISVRGDTSGGEGLHVHLEGSPECVDSADSMISELLRDPRKADEEKARQLGGVTGAIDGAGLATSKSTYIPQPVASLTGNGGGGHYGPSPGNDQFVEEKIGVPNGVVGYLIGRGGENIISMQRKSGCKVQIQKEHEMEPGSRQRVITLTADNRDGIDSARGIIEAMVQEKVAQAGGSGMGMGGGVGVGGSRGGGGDQTSRLQQAIAEGQVHLKVPVPNGDVGLIIGRGGSSIKNIQDRSGANVQIPPEPDADNPHIRTVNVTHADQAGAEFAKQLIEHLLKEKAERQQGGGGGGGGGGPGYGGHTIEVDIPDHNVGLCIGKGGCVIRAMQDQTGCRIQIPSQPVPGMGFRRATVTGAPDKCEEVRGIMTRISSEQSSAFVTNGGMGNAGMGGGHHQYGGQGRYGHVQHHQQSGVQDNSAQWAAYYASQAATAASTAAVVPAPAASAGDQPKRDAYYEDFFRYAAHYGEKAAREYYGAWSPPEGTPIPSENAGTAVGGTAANGSGAAATATAASSAPVGYGSASNSADAKDSSVRKVSNLPAWMTKKG